MPEFGFKELQDVLYNELRLMHYPIAVKFLFSQDELDDFRANVGEYYSPFKPATFCQWQIAPRMKGQTVLGLKQHLGCSNAAYVFGWHELDDAEIESHAKYTRDLEQAERFVRSKPRLPEGLLGVVVSPLADAYFPPDTVHFYCDPMQAYHLAVDYMAAMDIHPLPTQITMNSSACGGNVQVYLSGIANLLPACSGSYNSGKTERGEVNFILPGAHLESTVRRLLERKERSGSSSVTRPGDLFPGSDVCKNCPLIAFRKQEAG